MATQETPNRTDVLVIGGGPAGAAAGYWLARQGHDVTIVERKTFPRDKTCGDGLTPRAVHQLTEMGLAPQLEKYHRYTGLRATGMGRELELQWPSHPVYPGHGFVVRRMDAYGLPNALRITIGTEEANRGLVATLKAFLS